MSAEHHQKRFVEYLGSADLRRFEMKGYEQMMVRLLDAPLKTAQKVAGAGA